MTIYLTWKTVISRKLDLCILIAIITMTSHRMIASETTFSCKMNVTMSSTLHDISNAPSSTIYVMMVYHIIITVDDGEEQAKDYCPARTKDQMVQKGMNQSHVSGTVVIISLSQMKILIET